MINETGLYATISLNQCISSAKQQLLIESGDSDIWFEKLANDAARHMDSLSIFIKRQCTLTINNGKAKLPNGFYRLLGMRFNGTITGGCASVFYVDQPFLNGIGCNANGVSSHLGSGVFQIQNGFIIFASNIDVTNCTTGLIEQATSVNVAFVGLNVDDDGLMIVREDMERGITAYICYMYMKQNPNQYPQWAMQEEKATWMAQKEWIKSNDIQNQFRNTRRQIASIANAWITSKSWWI